jgi:hypothetical protein
MNDTMYYRINEIIEKCLVPSINGFGMGANLICIIIFIKILKHNSSNTNPYQNTSSHMYHYLLIKTICDLVINFCEIIFFISKRVDPSPHKFYASAFIKIVFHFYLYYSLYLSSGLFDIMAALDCSLLIDNRMRWCRRRVSFIITTISILFIFFTFELFIFFFEQIHTKVINGTTFYSVRPNDEKTFNELLLVESIIRDVVTLNIILIINIYILFKLFQIKKRKTFIRKIRRSVGQTIENRAKNQKIIMIISLFVIHVSGHLLLFISFLVRVINNDEVIKRYTFMFGQLFTYIPISFSFFIYFFFNNVFRLIFFEIILFFKTSNRIQPTQSITI